MRCMRWLSVILVLSLSGSIEVSAQTPPTIDQVISLRRPGLPVISPDGRYVAYTVSEARWEENDNKTEIWLAEVQAGTRRQLTDSSKSSSAPAWSADGRRLAFISTRTGKRQIYLIDPHGGEAQALTSTEQGVRELGWSPDGTLIAYTMDDPRSKALDEREKKYGQFDVVGQDKVLTHLWVINVATKASRRLTEGRYSVGRFAWSPDGAAIAFDHRPDNDASHTFDADISIVSVADARVTPLVSQPGLDEHPVWSPDGTRIAFITTLGNPDSLFDTNTVIATISVSGGTVEPLTKGFDENPLAASWGTGGIFFAALERTASSLFSLDPATRKIVRIGPSAGWTGSGYSFSRDYSTVAFIGASPQTFPEIFVAPVRTMEAKRLTNLGEQIAAWPKTTREVISWKSRDGTRIEGVLHKPADFQTGRRYPLLIVVKGGPTSVSTPIPYSNTNPYPIDLWLAKGALVLEPNYRGSAGYGGKFRSRNVRNLGVGDAWDVLSGIDDLVARGLADNDRVGVMGWSQGGYISAFLATHDSARFRAVSVGAGISDWMTYYVNTDIHVFTRHFLKATPWDDPEIYAKTSPITYIKQATAPTLIQHNSNDPRVPLPNAYELYQGLCDRNVPARLIVYKALTHSLNTPKGIRAAMEHNLAWFNQYIWGEKPTDGSETCK